ncbi:unknown [Clostridium sp. CAG:628]|nr:unknown [Clostridium sp. CAG:628]
MRDAFSVNNTSAKLDYPVGLMTIDELSYAGGETGEPLTAPYIWYYTNANGESSYASATFWSLSPSGWFSSGSYVWFVLGSGSPGILGEGGIFYSLAVRPSVSLLSCNLISRGNGSPENPYVVYTGSGVCE